MVPLILRFFRAIYRAARNPGGFFASDEEIEMRRFICSGCPLNVNGICGACSCIIHAKTALATEECPHKHW
jgi:hypothetical protein